MYSFSSLLVLISLIIALIAIIIDRSTKKEKRHVGVDLLDSCRQLSKEPDREKVVKKFEEISSSSKKSGTSIGELHKTTLDSLTKGKLDD